MVRVYFPLSNPISLNLSSDDDEEDHRASQIAYSSSIAVVVILDLGPPAKNNSELVGGRGAAAEAVRLSAVSSVRFWLKGERCKRENEKITARRVRCEPPSVASVLSNRLLHRIGIEQLLDWKRAAGSDACRTGKQQMDWTMQWEKGSVHGS